MRVLLLLMFALLYCTGTWAQAGKEQAANEEVLMLKETDHDFGQIAQGKPVFYNFQITNRGTTPLKLENVIASCGCTTPEWKNEPIAPGATDVIRVGYNAATEGHFEKSITVYYNENQTKQLLIKGMVWKAPAASAPVNRSINFLKQQMQQK